MGNGDIGNNPLARARRGHTSFRRQLAAAMLAAELAAHKQKNKTSAPPINLEVGPTATLPTADSASPLDGGAGGLLQVSQSLPIGGHSSLLGFNAPPKPRGVRPSPAPSFTAVPILELPEPSLSDSFGDTTGGLLEEVETATAAPDVEESGGTSLFAPPEPRAISFQYAASAPASMLWGAHARKPGSSSMGGRVPSKTMLDVLQQR